MDDSGLVPNVSGEHTLYLIPSFEDDEEVEGILRKIYAEVFENELYGWHTNETAWPKNRTLAMFKKWFEIELYSMVEDVCGEEFIDDEG